MITAAKCIHVLYSFRKEEIPLIYKLDEAVYSVASQSDEDLQSPRFTVCFCEHERIQLEG